MRAAIYARYSSEDLQDDSSIEDQVALARTWAERAGLAVVDVFADPAVSGADILDNRPGLKALLKGASEKRYIAVITESIDRIGRDVELSAFVYKRLTFHGVRLVTLADGDVTPLHIGLKGTMAQLFLADLAQKLRRAGIGRARAGRIATGKAYGYDVTSTLEERGLRAINATEAEIVRRIFREVAAGASPQAIVHRLNAEGVRSPFGRKWGPKSIAGDRRRLCGIVNNEIYKGVLVWNRSHNIRNPDTGRPVSRINPERDWIRVLVPHLRIVDDVLWAAAHAELDRRRRGPVHQRRRPRHPFSGLIHCAACGEPWHIATGDWLGCAGARKYGTCGVRRMLRMAEIEARVLAVLRERLLAPDVIAAAVKRYRERMTELASQARSQRGTLTRDLSEAERRLAALTRAIEEGAEPAALAPRINALAAERDRAHTALKTLREPAVVDLHPGAADRYREQVQALGAGLWKNEAGAGRVARLQAVALVRRLVERILVIETPKGERLGLEVHGSLALLIDGSDAAVGAGPRLVCRAI